MAEEKRKAVMIGAAKAAPVSILGKEYLFLYNGNAMFAIKEEFNTVGFFPDLSFIDAEGLHNLLRVCEILSEQAEAKLHREGYESKEPFRKEDADPLDAAPGDYLALQSACMAAALMGHEREIADENEKIDLIALRRQKKRG